MASDELFGDPPSRVATATVNEPATKASHQLDTVVFGQAENHRAPILAIGEVKWGEAMGHGHLNRLRHIRGLLTAQGRLGAEQATLACFSGAGFTPELEAEARLARDITLIEIGALYS
ncbi:MAG: hypothetical protein ACRDQ7_15885 [Haloechinothrix sp.]